MKVRHLSRREYIEGRQRWLRGLILPPRGPTRDPSNINRARHVAAALHQGRISHLTPDHQRAHRIGCSLCAVKLRYQPRWDPRK